MKTSRHIILLCLAATTALATPQPAGDTLTFCADGFVDFIGLAATPFEKGTREKMPPETFFDLGVRYYRTGVCGPATMDDQPEEIEKWWRKTGARPMFLVDPVRSRAIKSDWLGVPQDGDFSHFLNLIKKYDPRVIATIEAPNEVNNKFPPQDLNVKYKGATDERAGALYQQDLYAALKADPVTADIPVVMYSAIFTDYTLARPCDAFDYMNMHSYQGTGVPSSSLRRNIAHAARLLPDGGVIKPFMPTECGYNVEEDIANHTGLTGTLRAQAYNIPMLLAEYFRHGIARAYLFALHNADGYGLLESDSVTKRPSWYAVQSLIALLADQEWDPEALRWVAKEPRARILAAPTSELTFSRELAYDNALLFTLENAPATVHTLTLKKDNGDDYLLIWNEVPNYERGKEISPPAVPRQRPFRRPAFRRQRLHQMRRVLRARRTSQRHFVNARRCKTWHICAASQPARHRQPRPLALRPLAPRASHRHAHTAAR